MTKEELKEAYINMSLMNREDLEGYAEMLKNGADSIYSKSKEAYTDLMELVILSSNVFLIKTCDIKIDSHKPDGPPDPNEPPMVLVQSIREEAVSAIKDTLNGNN